MLHLRNFRKISRPLSALVLVNFLFVLISPTTSFALTGGPNSPQSSGFTAGGNGTSVDPFTGDFSYSIPLLDAGGYPLALNYSAGVSPEDEASWVGLGWNLDVGSINRQVRGLADDYKGDEIKTTQKSKPNVNTSANVVIPGNSQKEVLGFPIGADLNLNLGYNNYSGPFFGVSVTPEVDFSTKTTNEFQTVDSSSGTAIITKFVNQNVGSVTGAVGLSSDGNVTFTPGLSFKKVIKDGEASQTLSNTSLTLPFSTREGAEGLSFGGFDSESRANGSHTIPFSGFADPTYTPGSKTDVVNLTLHTDFKLDKLKASGFVSKEIIGAGFSQSVQYEKDRITLNDSYGYLYESESNNADNLLDFNTEKIKGVSKETRYLGMANHTHDIYQVSGNGVGGAYRIFRTDAIVLEDDESKESIFALNPSLGVGAFPADPTGASFKVSADLGVQFGAVNSGRQDNFLSKLGNGNNISDQKTYFARIGEATPELDLAYFNNFLKATENFGVNILRNSGRTTRKNRTTSFSYFIAYDCQNNHMQFDAIKSYTYNTFDFTQPTPTQEKINIASNLMSSIPKPRIDDNKKGHHISEIRVINESGQRFIYGIPVYNNKQFEVTFSKESDSITTDRKNGLITYGASDASLENDQGLDRYYQKREVPAYASSYLLTYQLSHDYIDSDEIQGPSDGDLGNYVRFNYTKTSDAYAWRTPYDKDKANFADGLAGKRNDDKGSYTYGEKELWYNHSIETRDYIVQFELEERLDGVAVNGENGGIKQNPQGKDKLRRLKEIRLYSKRDKLSGKTELLKTVHFEYDYSLCPGTPNSLANGGGKLTLKKIWFTYGNSNKGKENPYIFSYGDSNFDGTTETSLNPNYNKKSLDRWGTYKAEETTIGNEEFPYTLQEKSKSDIYAGVYAMNRILTPTGGEIRVYYEADDYAHVQNHKAMRMFKITGLGNDGVSTLYNNALSYNDNLSTRIHVDLGEEGIVASSIGEAKEIFLRDYLGDAKYLNYQIYARVYPKANNNAVQKSEYDRISAYSEYKSNSIEIATSSESVVGGKIRYKKVSFELSPEGLNKGTSENGKIHPFLKNAMIFARLNYNKECYEAINYNEGGVDQFISLIPNLILALTNTFLSFKQEMLNKNVGMSYDLDRSYIRLYEGDRTKLGGGHRVKAIVNFDRWDEMKGNKEISPFKSVAGYGQIYDYTTTESYSTTSGTKERTISSGVAAYEPLIGGEENPFRQIPNGLESKRVFLAPDKQLTEEFPYGESFMPSPTVGYSKVSTIPVKILNKTDPATSFVSNGTGSIEEEFFTAKDFPTYIYNDVADIDALSQGVKLAQSVSNTFNPFIKPNIDYMYANQNYRIELNDMHGKPKSKKVLASAPIGKKPEVVSYVEYKYKTDPQNNKKLYSKVKLVDNQLAIGTQESELGTTVDVWSYVQSSYTDFANPQVQANVTLKFPPPALPPVPFPLPTFMGSLSFTDKDFRTEVSTKIVNRYGVLEETIVHENGQTLTTKNLLWDKFTGDVLLTRVDNEFKNSIYSFNYPAHWAYESMGLAADNEGFAINNISNINTLIDGDELVVLGAKFITGDVQTTSPTPVYAYYNIFSANNKVLLDKAGNQITNFDYARVVRSGKRNVSSMSVGSVSMLENPIVGSNVVVDATKKILNTGAVELKNVWKGFCNCGERIQSNNPYITGEKGQLRVWKNWTYLTSRTQTQTNGELNIRFDGYLEDYLSFWKTTTGTYMLPFHENLPENYSKEKWQFVTEIENYNPIGQEIENKDALNRYSMAQFGYGRNLPVGVSNNSKYSDSGFDGFEDYGYNDCADDHFSWRTKIGSGTGKTSLSPKAHTGLNSIEVKPKQKVGIIKDLTNCN